jgi:hypothetical protein
VRVLAAYHDSVGLVGEVDVVGVAALAAHQHRVLGAPHWLSDPEFLQCPLGFVAKIHEFCLVRRRR